MKAEIKKLSKVNLSKQDRFKAAQEKFDVSDLLRYEDRCKVPTSDKIDHVGVKPGIMDRMVLDKESESTRREIKEKAMRIAPAFNKGGYEYLGKELSDTLKTNKRR